MENGSETDAGFEHVPPKGDSALAGDPTPVETLGIPKRFWQFLVQFYRRRRRRKVPNPDREMRMIENQEELIKWLKFQSRLLTPVHSFYRGIAIGLGLMLGTGLVLSVVIHLLSKLALVPLLGDLANQIMHYLENAANGG